MIEWHQYFMGIVFVLAGLNHFRIPKFYQKIVPNYIPEKRMMVLISGILEIILGILLLIPNTQSLAAWGIILMMIAFLPVHIFMLQDKRESMKLPKWALIFRLILQFGIIYWAYLYV